MTAKLSVLATAGTSTVALVSGSFRMNVVNVEVRDETLVDDELMAIVQPQSLPASSDQTMAARTPVALLPGVGTSGNAVELVPCQYNPVVNSSSMESPA